MNNSKTPKIVVGVGLVAVYAVALTFLTVRDKPESAVTQSETSAASAQMVAAPIAPPVAIPESADALAAEAIAPAVASAPKPRMEEVPVASLPSPRPPVPSDAEELSRSNTGSNAVSELAATAEAVPSESVTSVEDTSSDEDSESTAEVSPEIIGN